MQENQIKVTINKVDDEAEEMREPSSDEKMVKDALRSTEGMMKLLIKRKSRPEWNMTRRKKRLYLKRLQIGSGPYRSTLQLATKISLLIGGTSAAQMKIIDPFEAAWWTNFIDEDALQLIEDAKELERQMPLVSAAVMNDAEEEQNLKQMMMK